MSAIARHAAATTAVLIVAGLLLVGGAPAIASPGPAVRPAPVVVDAEDPLATMIVRIDQRTWRGSIVDEARVWAEWRWSLDGATWAPWSADPGFDLAAQTGAAAWYDGDQRIWAQVRDAAGTASEPALLLVEFVDDDLAAPHGGEGPVSVDFEFPRPAITGRDFTIRLVYPEGYTLPANAWCQWYLIWGDDEAIAAFPNESFGEVLFERHHSSGACNEWTLTLPYTDAGQFSWWVDVYTKRASDGPDEKGHPIFSGPAGRKFRALTESTDRHIHHSNVGIAYVLPDVEEPTRVDAPVTYRLHLAGPGTLPRDGHWFAYGVNCPRNPDITKEGGLSWTYTPVCGGAWVTGWTGTMGGGWTRAQFDPKVDARAPNVARPTTTIRATTVGAAVPVTVAWSAKDKLSGVARYELQVSRDGGAWRGVDLATRKTTAVSRSLSPGHAYRFRVRARDGVGNWSAWVAGATLRPRLVHDSAPSLVWSGQWTSIADSAALGARARRSTEAGASVRFKVTARSIGWIAARGPGYGRARVYVDGTLVATVDLHAATASSRRVVWQRTWSSSVTRVVRIVVEGTADHPTVDVDGFIVLR